MKTASFGEFSLAGQVAVGDIGAMTGRQLQDALTRLGCSTEDLADRLMVHRSAVYRWLNGQRRIPGPVVAAVRCWLEQEGA